MTWTPSIVNLLWEPLSDVCRQKIIWHHGNLWKCTKKIILNNIGFTKYILGSYFLLYPLSVSSMNLMLMLVENDENLHFNKMPTIERMDSSQSHFLSIKYPFAKIRVIVNPPKTIPGQKICWIQTNFGSENFLDQKNT